MVVKTFRGLLADGGQDRIRLSTIKGKVGYKIVKLAAIGRDTGSSIMEHTVKIYKTKQTSIDNTVDFTDSDLLAVDYIQGGAGVTAWSGSSVIIFDNEVFNQDIYITQEDTHGSSPCNYYLELEVIPLDDAGAEYTTLKDMRQ